MVCKDNTNKRFRHFFLYSIFLAHSTEFQHIGIAAENLTMETPGLSICLLMAQLHKNIDNI